MIGEFISYQGRISKYVFSVWKKPTSADQRLFRKRFSKSRAKSLISAVEGLKAHLESYPKVITLAVGMTWGMKSRGHMILLSAVQVV